MKFDNILIRVTAGGSVLETYKPFSCSTGLLCYRYNNFPSHFIQASDWLLSDRDVS
jgi:hypothetical protein